MTSPATTGDARALWLATLQTLFGRASHDVKDALNGVAVNLEVIRSRAGRADVPPSAIVPFAEGAGQQLERLTTLLEALLAAGRVERSPVDVDMTLRRIATLCGASSSAADASVEVQASTTGRAITDLGGDVVRLALAAPLLALVTSPQQGGRASAVHCTVQEDESGVVVTMRAAGRRAAMPASVAGALHAAGIRWRECEQGNEDLSLVFPHA